MEESLVIRDVPELIKELRNTGIIFKINTEILKEVWKELWKENISLDKNSGFYRALKRKYKLIQRSNDFNRFLNTL